MRDGRVLGNGDANTAGNGALIRLAPVSIFDRNSLRQSWRHADTAAVVTHNALEAGIGCQFLSVQLYYALNGQNKDATLAPKILLLSPRNMIINAGEYKQKTRDQIRSSGYVIDTLEAALFGVLHSSDFEEAILLAANFADDAYSVAATAGLLAGTLYGLSGIPARWRKRVARSEHIVERADWLFEIVPPSIPEG